MDINRTRCGSDDMGCWCTNCDENPYDRIKELEATLESCNRARQGAEAENTKFMKANIEVTRMEQCNCDQALYWKDLAKKLARAYKENVLDIADALCQQIETTKEINMDTLLDE